MVKTVYLYLCNNVFVNGQINLVLQTNHLDVIVITLMLYGENRLLIFM